MYISNHHEYCPYIESMMREDKEILEGNNNIREVSNKENDSSDRATVCQQFASILGAVVKESKSGMCSVERPRPGLRVTISGRPVSSVIKGEFSYQSSDAQGRTLNLGEIALREEEVNPFITVLRRNGITVSAAHNHWIFDNPHIIYLHFQSIERPLDFANKVAQALRGLTR